jgi:Ice-binding-like
MTFRRTLTAGVYNSTSTLAPTGAVTLDAKGDPNAVFIFQIASTLTTGSASHVNLINGAQPCNVFWKLDTATLGTNSTFVGTILALTSISVHTGTTVEGPALARHGQVALDTNTFTTPARNTATTTTTAVPTTTSVPAPAKPVTQQPSFTG